MVVFDGFNDALIGQACAWVKNSKQDKLVYDGWRMVDVLMKRDGMSVDEAYEFIEYNVEGTYAGEQTPIIMWALEDIEKEELKILKQVKDAKENGKFH